MSKKQEQPAHKKHRLRNRGFVLGGAFLIVLAGIAISERVSVSKTKPEIESTLNSYMGEIANLNIADLNTYKLGENLTNQQKQDIKSKKSEIADKYWSGKPMYKSTEDYYQIGKSDFVSADINGFGKLGTSQKYDVKLKDMKISLEGNNYAKIDAIYTVNAEGFYCMSKESWENHEFEWMGLAEIEPNGYSKFSGDENLVTQHLSYTEEMEPTFVMEKVGGDWKITYIDGWIYSNITDYSVVED